jgi:hypothetical protein
MAVDSGTVLDNAVSEYQYYEFQAIERLLDAKAQAELRAISSRARITATSFVNHYEWGDLKADPLKLLARYFDLHLYLANWGTRLFAMKLPRRLVDVEAVRAGELDEEQVLLRRAGEHVLLSIMRSEIDVEEWDDGSGWLSALAPLRGELLAGDLRVVPLLWLIGVENGSVPDGSVEPAPGIRLLSPPLAALAEFLCIDTALLEAAVGTSRAQPPAEPEPGDIEGFVRGLAEEQKVALLLRLYAGDAHAGVDLRRLHVPPPVANGQFRARTAGELRAAARRIEQERRRRAEEKAAAEQRRREREVARARAERVQALAGRENKAWADAEALIGLRNPKGYDRAATLLGDLGELADRGGTYEAFARRLSELRARHSGKRQFIGRLDAAGLSAR